MGLPAVTAIFVMFLSVDALYGQRCKRTSTQTKLKKKLDRFVRLTDKLLCIPEPADEEDEIYAPRRPLPVKSVTEQLITAAAINFQTLLQLFKSKNVQIILSIGDEDGEFDAQKYSKMASDEESRAKFVANVFEVLSKYEMNGLLVHWFYPVAWGNNLLKPKQQDFENYPLLMKALSEKFKDKKMVLHAIGTGLFAPSKLFNFKKLEGVVDLWHLNTYHYEGSWSSTTAISTSLIRVLQCFKIYTNFIPPSRILIGVPLYNSPLVLNNKSKTKLNSLVRSRDSHSSRLKIFTDICVEAAQGGVTVVHNESGTPNTYAFKDGHWTSFESAISVAKRAEFVRQNNLAGVFVKFLDQDDVDGTACKCGKFHMLRAINEGLRGDGSCVSVPCP